MSGSGPCVLKSWGTTLTSKNSGSLDFVVRMNLLINIGMVGSISVILGVDTLTPGTGGS